MLVASTFWQHLMPLIVMFLYLLPLIPKNLHSLLFYLVCCMQLTSIRLSSRTCSQCTLFLSESAFLVLTLNPQFIKLIAVMFRTPCLTHFLYSDSKLHLQIYVEVERARLSRILAQIFEEQGRISEAATVLQELQVNFCYIIIVGCSAITCYHYVSQIFLKCKDLFVASTVLAVVVCLPVHLSQTGIVSRRLHIGSRKQCHAIAQRLQFSDAKNFFETRTGHPKCQWGGVKSANFDK